MFLCIGLITCNLKTIFSKTRVILAQSTLKMNSKLNLICD